MIMCLAARECQSNSCCCPNIRRRGGHNSVRQSPKDLENSVPRKNLVDFHCRIGALIALVENPLSKTLRPGIFRQ
jgi:hypothetical protein